jgi:hypothetical protein
MYVDTAMTSPNWETKLPILYEKLRPKLYNLNKNVGE